MKNIIKTLLVLGTLLLTVTSYSEVDAATPPPQDVVKNTSEQVLERLRSDPSVSEDNPALINELVDELIIPRFDFVKMSRWVLGKNWKKATDEQKKRFTNAFQKLLIRTYAKSLMETSGEISINYLPVHAEDGSKRVTVKTEIDRGNGAPLVPIHYRLYRKGDNWKVYDVVVNGASLVSTYRGSFNSEIRSKGLESLINDLEKRS